MTRVKSVIAGGILATLGVLPASGQGQFDTIFLNGSILDGTGNPWFRADVGIRADKIAAVGDLHEARAHRIIDATGLVVVPGFIDIHSHADDSEYGDDGLRSADPRRRAAPSLVRQGITTVVVNQDGWMVESGIAAQRAIYDSLGIGPNVAMMVGHNVIRRQVMGDDHRREATDDEIQHMRALVRGGMEAGAVGLSTGLEYVPGRWSTTGEVVALVHEIVPFGGVYIAHQRSEAVAPMWWRPSQHAENPLTGLDALRETIHIAETTGATVVATHIKTRGESFRGKSDEAVRLIEEARARGLSVYADQYPYTTSGSDGSTVLLPMWALTSDTESDDFRAALKQTLADTSLATNVARDVAHLMAFRGGPQNIRVFEFPDSSVIGLSLAELAKRLGLDPLDIPVWLQINGFADRPGGARLRSFSMSENDLATFAAQPWVATASDGGIAVAEDDSASVHIRYYGTFPRKIAEYAMKQNLMTVAEAIRSSTSLPAQIIGLTDRGLVRTGMQADIAVLDLDAIGESATFTDPHGYATGVRYVMIGGHFAVDDSETTWSLQGRPVVRSSSE